ncbi:MAG TPA: hypothetical protein VL171_06690 [Verrucomicrobiae bacterium]|nr:hypothetical protein [Verrucomicrobiae bacterium]
MIQRSMVWLFAFASLFLSSVAWAGPDPLVRLKGFSEFPSVNIQDLLKGEILSEPGALMDFKNGISAQTCYAVFVPAQQAARKLQLWNPSLHQDLKIFKFHPVNEPSAPMDFRDMSLKSNQRPIRWLLDKTRATTPTQSDLNLSKEEAEQLAACVKNHPDPQAVSACWAQLLQQRALAFEQQGFAGVAPYETGGETMSPVTQLRTMLREQPAVATEFAPMLRESGVLGQEGKLDPFHYWGMYEADHRAVLNLGAVYLLPVGNRYQLMDAQYYVSGVYYSFVTLYEVWPIQLGNQAASLIWRGDFFAAPVLQFTSGFERLAYGAVMVQELKKAIRAFQDDVKTKP